MIVTQPATDEERAERAAWSSRRLGLEQSVTVDWIDDAVWRAYGAASAPAFVIDRHGRVALRQPWLEPSGIRRALDVLLADSPRPDR